MQLDYTHMIMNLVLMLIVVFILVVALKKIRFSKLSKGRQITILNTMPIGSKERVILLEVNNTNILIGATPTSISTLHVFNQMDAAKIVTDDYLNEMKSFSETLANQRDMIDG